MEILPGILILAILAIVFQTIIIGRELRSVNDSVIDIADELIRLRKVIACKKQPRKVKPQ